MADTAIAERSVPHDLHVQPPATPADRGDLHIEARVYSQIARQAALEVPGVVAYSVTLGSLTGRNLPRALADSASRHPAIAVEIAIAWPSSAAEVSAAVQRHVAEVLTRLTGRRPSRVDVDVVEVTQSELLLSEEIGDIVSAQQESPDSVLTRHDRTPRRYPAAALLAALLGLVAVLAAVVVGREYAVSEGHYDSEPWLEDAAGWLSGTAWQTWMVTAAIGAIVVGLWLLYNAIRPRARTHRAITAAPGVWTRDTDIARRLSAIALDDDTTVSATTTVVKGRAKVTVLGQPGSDGASLRERLDDALQWLESPPKIVLDHSAPPLPADMTEGLST
ncbi:Asp23/Gls24 family envelope stress response protein [Williamsia soli]|uniref:Asp23/Gls24 family envelope stress response protein n=1 Tax=Williamsia soli TaxID=364929 RepID=UPI001A9CD2CC|nr:Asp23/Gls24 family envelope stress response protein [Williamsia soli]